MDLPFARLDWARFIAPLRNGKVSAPGQMIMDRDGQRMMIVMAAQHV